MLRPRRALPLLVLVVSCLGISCSSTIAAPSPTTVNPATREDLSGIQTVRVGTIINSAAPTAPRDEQLVAALETAANLSTAPVAIEIAVIRIDGTDDADSAVASLVERGVTVIVTLCDDATVPAVIDASLDRDVLTITGCVSIPKPSITVESPLFIDLASLDDAGAASATWTRLHGATHAATIHSDLVPDVNSACLGYEAALAENGIDLDVSITFTELLDDPVEIVAEFDTRLKGANVIAVCALPPAAGDMVDALRSAGITTAIIVPWFTDTQQWSSSTNNVFVIAPASRYGDDPDVRVAALLRELGNEAQASDVVAGDTIAALTQAASLAGSVGSSRLANALSNNDLVVLSGMLLVETENATVHNRTYRVIAINDGVPAFESTVTPTRIQR